MRISDCSSDVCSSDLPSAPETPRAPSAGRRSGGSSRGRGFRTPPDFPPCCARCRLPRRLPACPPASVPTSPPARRRRGGNARPDIRSEEHTSELQSLMRISYAVLCLKKKQSHPHTTSTKILTINTDPKTHNYAQSLTTS